MHITLDYLVAGLVIIIILTFSANSIFSLTSTTLQHVEEEQLNPLAERLLDKILLTPGEPLDWGNLTITYDNKGNRFIISEREITDFGLGYVEMQNNLGSVIDPYVLDPDKVARMANKDFQPSSSRILQILGLTWDGIHPKYGFRLRIVPALNITITPTGTILRNGYNVPSKFDISVKSYDGYPAVNARVKAIYLVVQMEQARDSNQNQMEQARDSNQNQTEVLLNISKPIEVLTDWKGECNNIDFTNFLSNLQDGNQGMKKVEAYILLAYASYYGIRSFNQYYQYNYGNVLEASIMGSYLVIKFPENSEDPEGARHPEKLLQIGEYVVAKTDIDPKRGELVINKGHYKLKVLKIGGIDPWLNLNLLYIFWAPLQEPVKPAKYCLVVVDYPSLVDYSTSTYPGEGLKIFTTHRYCRIGSLTYVAELSVWRMAE
ncbi:MAG: hypothetical protein QXP91_13110 [Candidatus Methanomethylicia archaeon]